MKSIDRKPKVSTFQKKVQLFLSFQGKNEKHNDSFISKIDEDIYLNITESGFLSLKKPRGNPKSYHLTPLWPARVSSIDTAFAHQRFLPNN